MSTVKAQHAKLLAIIILPLLSACASLPADDIIIQTSPAVNAKSSGSELIQGYKGWTRVNPVPAPISSRLAQMCALPSARDIQREKGNPHLDKFITVYVNDLGKNAMMHEKQPRFPQGSVIVKEKLTSKDSPSPELLTVMIKREAGYNPDNGDWEYMAVDGAGKEVQERGRIERCQACHMMDKDNDYVSRSYLPSEVWEKLK